MEKYRVTNGDIELLVYEKSIRLKAHHQTIYTGREIPRGDAVKYAAMFMDIKRSGANESPDRMFKRTNTIWKCDDNHLVQENEQLKDTIQDLESQLQLTQLKLEEVSSWT